MRARKRLHRFLHNPRLDPRSVTDGLARLILGSRGRGLWPILFDQTKAGATQALFAGVPFQGRALPLAVYTFQYPWQEKTARSQNQLEEVFLADIETALPTRVRPVFIGDRGYARAALLRQSNRQGRLYIIRGRAGTRVEYQGRSCKLAELPGEDRRAIRYPRVLYQARERVPVDVVVYHDPEFQEPWWLLVPSQSSALLPVRTVVALYRERMQVEQSFRDFKTHLGLRGLRLKVNIAERTGRLLLAFTMAYCLALLLGISREAEKSSARFGDSASTPAPRKLSDFECALRGAGHVVTPALERTGPGATPIPGWLGGRRSLPAATGSAHGCVSSQRRCLK